MASRFPSRSLSSASAFPSRERRGLRSRPRVETGDLPYAGLSEALLTTLKSNCRDVGCAIKALE